MRGGSTGGPDVAILHLLIRYIGTPGKEACGSHDRALGLVEDILPHQYLTVDVPGSTFHLGTAHVRVPTSGSDECIGSNMGRPSDTSRTVPRRRP
jgi:hypothetical protein